MNNLHPIFQQALRPFVDGPAPLTEEQRQAIDSELLRRKQADPHRQLKADRAMFHEIQQRKGDPA